MSGVGRGKEAERTLEKKEQNKKQLNNTNLSKVESRGKRFRGAVSSSNIPEKLDFIDSEPEPAAETENNTTSPVYSNAEELEIQYEILMEGGGLELLEAMENGQDTSEYSDKLVELLSDQGLLEAPETDADFTDRGRHVYMNWTGFRDNYLTGNTDAKRFDAIESRIGVESIPSYLEESSGVEVTLDQYLRNKENIRSRFDPEPEFRSIMGSLYQHQRSQLGERVRALEVLSNPEEYDHEVSEDIQNEFRRATFLGLQNRDGTLTEDGEALYRKVRTDSYYMEW